MTFIGPDGRQRVAVYSGSGGCLPDVVPGNLSLDDVRRTGHGGRDERPAAIHARRRRRARVQDSLRHEASCVMSVVVFALFGTSGPCGGVVAAGQRALRVCADPDNLPFSNRRQQGFENKIAQLVAERAACQP